MSTIGEKLCELNQLPNLVDVANPFPPLVSANNWNCLFCYCMFLIAADATTCRLRTSSYKIGQCSWPRNQCCQAGCAQQNQKVGDLKNIYRHLMLFSKHLTLRKYVYFFKNIL